VRPQVGVFGAFERQRVVDADAEIIGTVVLHVFEHGDQVAGPHVAAAQPRRTAVNARDAVDFFQAVLAGRRVAEGGFDLASQVVAGRRERVVHPLDDAEGAAILERIDDCLRWEGPEAIDIEAAGFDAFAIAQVIDRGLRRLHVTAHAD